MVHRIVVFTGDLSYTVRAGIVDIDGASDGLAWLIIVAAPTKTVRGVLRSQVRNLRRNGWRWIPYQFNDLAVRINRARPGTVAATAPGRDYSHDAFNARGRMRVVTVDDIHGDKTAEVVRAFGPDLGIALASPILRPSLFAIPKLGTLNLHKGKVPEYRGMPPAFWELWNDEDHVGCTVHRIDAKLDTGDVVCETTIERQRYSTVRALQLALDDAGIRLMRNAVLDTISGAKSAVPQRPGGVTYRKPTLAQIRELDRRLARMQPSRERGVRGWAKEAACLAATVLSTTGMLRLIKPRVTVLLYHRVSDDARDNLTVGIEQFNRQMELLSQHCRAIPIEQLVSLECAPMSEQPLVCVTFDDGYLDNYTFAAPILERHCIPAAFFVSTGIVGTDRPFPHDVRRGNAKPPAMRWEHIRSLYDRGFTIGSHSVTHIDCAAEPEENVLAELTLSLKHLRCNLGIADAYFAYPFGGREHMTPQRLELVKSAGYTACLSAYGGTNAGRIDRFNILRGGIHWGFSDRAFLVRCLGLA